MSDFSEIVFSKKWHTPGQTLVEASAGTGKTYNIQNVYLRLILEGLSVQQILVVTFTEAATTELRERLRTVLIDCRNALGKRGASTPEQKRVQEAIKGAEGQGTKNLEQKIQLALMDFDRAAIFTIHGFCKRVLDRYAFECGHDPDAELIPEQTLIIREACQDWWRQNAYDHTMSQTVPFAGLEKLVGLVKVKSSHPDAEMRPGPVPPVTPAPLKDSLKTPNNIIPLASAKKLLAQINESSDKLIGNEFSAGEQETILSEMRSQAEKAEWNQPPEVPDCIAQLIDECKSLYQSGRGQKSWLDDTHLKWGTTTWDATALLELLKDPSGEIQEWVESNPPFKTSSKPKALLSLIESKGKQSADEFHATVKIIEKISGASDILGKIKFTIEDAEPDLNNALLQRHTALLSKQVEVAAKIAERVRERIRDRSALTYDAMLLNVREVLNNDGAGPRLKEVLREEFKAALIDEFQDTDSIQYSIFHSIFAEKGSTPAPLVFVGDPKQAIYGFRGGDIFTYYEAKKKLSDKHTHSLGTNYRSESNLVGAINGLFKDQTKGDTFLNPGVYYDGCLKANDTGKDKELLVDGKRDDYPLKIWKYLKEDEKKNEWAADVAKETVRILSDDMLKIGGNPIKPSQIAILTMTHWEAEDIQTELLAKGINAVRQATGNVFDSAEAPKLALVMQAMLEPGRASLVRSALCTGLVPCTQGQVAHFNAENEALNSNEGGNGGAESEEAPSDDYYAPPSSLEGWVDIFREAGLRWHKRSFMEAFQFLSKRLGIRAHIAKRKDGERDLADILHLVESTHQAARERKLGATALLRWFICQLDEAQRDDADEEGTFKTRLSSDDDAVTIMTLFKSKGLEFPIVFLPTLWRRKSGAKRNGDEVLKYHETTKGESRLILDLDTKSETGKKLASEENHQENIRLAYVGLTRAINRVYLFEMEENSDTDKYAVAHLIKRLPHQPGPTRDTPVRANGIEWSIAPDLPDDVWKGNDSKPKPESLKPRELEGAVDKIHGHASFSSLAPHETATKSQLSDNRHDMDANPNESKATGPETELLPIFQIYGGAKVGTCWHEIFENLDFKASDANIQLRVNETLDKYRVCKEPAVNMPKEKQALMTARRDSVTEMVKNTLQVPLDSGCGKLHLKDIPLSSRRSELEFNFSLKDEEQIIGGVADILDNYWNSEGGNQEFIESIRGKESTIPRGFMTGFIDLTFEKDDRFYIVDWKSNQLNRQPDGFDKEGLKEEMTKHSYYLQYLIYTVAIHGFLSRALEGYDYETHFGGVFYLFLRGIDGKTQKGVFTDRPSQELILALSDFLGGSQ